MRCCNPLLYVWAYTHFFAKNHMGKFPDPLRSFPRIPSSRKYAMVWKAEMEGCTENTFTWMCPWFRPSHVLVRCGQFSNLPLMGLRGCIAYSPKLVLRQLGRTQTLPNQEDFDDIFFLYTSGQQSQVDTIREAWKRPLYFGDSELGKPQVTASDDYQKWRNQGEATNMTKMVDQNEQHRIDPLIKKIEILETQI
uniref:DUF7745 domain-containing protein n=1 Tax=Cajanus cajan TaxID=3821 RepID=A0A151QR98_CAJCA|nr:hypothetical protein KK1_046448 [Cajanus cajan]